MARDIFALPIEWADDARPTQFEDIDGTTKVLTVDRALDMYEKALDGHDPFCQRSKCQRECWFLGPQKQGVPRTNKSDHPSRRRIGFHKGDSQ